MPYGERCISISAKTGKGLDELLRAIDKTLDKGTRSYTLHIPYDKGNLLDRLYQEAKVTQVEYAETIDVTALCDRRTAGQLKFYIEGWVEDREDWET